jgi:hypothetical protein
MVGNPDLPLGAHHAPDVDGGEDQRTRQARERAAVEVCLSCPVVVACDRYANSVTAEGRLAEPEGVWGGRRALERHRAFIAHRQELVAPAADRAFQTKQRQAVLKALASFADPDDVAAWAGVDLRTANWQRSRIVGLLSLDKATATRRQVLEEAVRRGLLDASLVVADDGTVPAVPPPLSTTPHVLAATPELAAPVQLSFPLFFNEPMEAAA